MKFSICTSYAILKNAAAGRTAIRTRNTVAATPYVMLTGGDSGTDPRFLARCTAATVQAIANANNATMAHRHITDSDRTGVLRITTARSGDKIRKPKAPIQPGRLQSTWAVSRAYARSPPR